MVRSRNFLPFSMAENGFFLKKNRIFLPFSRKCLPFSISASKGRDVCGPVGLFFSIVGLFFSIVGLFFSIVGLFCLKIDLKLLLSSGSLNFFASVDAVFFPDSNFFFPRQ